MDIERALEKASEAIFSICKYLLMVFLVVIAVVITANVFGRYVLNSPIYWAEEAARWCYVWATFLGATCGYKRWGLVSMSVLIKSMRPSMRWQVSLVMEVVIAFFLAVALVHGARMTHMVLPQRMPATHMSMAVMYVSIPVSCSLMLTFNIHHIVLYLKRRELLAVWGENWG